MRSELDYKDYFRSGSGRILFDTVSMAEGPGVVRKGELGIYSIREVRRGRDVLEVVRKRLSDPDAAVFDDRDYQEVLIRLFDLKEKAKTLSELAGARVPMVETLDALFEKHGEKNETLVAKKIVEKYPGDPAFMEMVLRKHAITKFGLYHDKIERNRGYEGPFVLC